MTKKLIALLLCITMLGSMTVYAVDGETDPTETSAAVEITEAPEAPEVLEAPEVPEAPEASEAPEAPETTETTEPVEGGFAISAMAETLEASGTITSPLYYLDGTDWNMGTNSIEITKSGASSAMGTYETNAVVITEADIKALADANTDVDLVIYARSGMALGFASGTTWPAVNWVLADSNNGQYKYENWEWVWNGSVNYAILADGVTSVAKAEFELVEDDTSTTETEICKVQVYIIPDNKEPTLVDRNRVRTLGVTLYNYDGHKFNEYYSNLNQDWLIFSSISMGKSATEDITYKWTDANLPNSGNVSTGIMKKKLGENKLPAMYGDDQTDFFSTDTLGGAKTVYENVEMEFIYDPETAYYYYSSNLNHAQFFESEDRIKLYNETLAPQFLDTTSETEQMDKAGFYPFADITKAFSAYATPVPNYQYWYDDGVLSSEYFQQKALLVKDIVATGSTAPASTIDMHFGLQMEVDFYMPTGRQNDVNNDGVKEDLIYSFTGDDDLWVYIDDDLVLDIGGAHTAINGVINFTDETVTVSNSGDVKYENGTYVATGVTGARSWTFEELGIKFDEDRMHTMRVFYLERWSGVSNCRMHFNLPIVPKNSVVVSKNVLNQDGEKPAIDPNDEYEFTVYAKDRAEVDFSVLETFKLKDGQNKIIEGVDRFTEVYVVENDPNGKYVYPSASVSVNSVEAVEYIFGQQTSTVEMQEASNITFSFTNTIQTYDLTVKKELINEQGATVSIDTTYPIQVKINGADYGDYTITTVKPAVIENIPANMTYEVTEGTLPVAPYGFKYEQPEYTNKSGTLAADTTTTVTNELIALLADLKIVKEGIAPVDYHESNVTGNQERQSTIYKITGTTAAGDVIEPIYVTIRGVTATDNYVMIKELPVGTYTITEMTDWSWRYTVSDISAVTDKEVTKSNDGASITIDFTYEGETITYTNNRSNIFWLSGDNWARNLFNGAYSNPAPDA